MYDAEIKKIAHVPMIILFFAVHVQGMYNATCFSSRYESAEGCYITLLFTCLTAESSNKL